ncbi:MAG: type I 3-dehydroquinate dehydratase [Alphaproteobacteria bacterium]
MALRWVRRRARLVGVITSSTDLDRAVRMRRPPDLFEIRLDCLTEALDQLQNKLPRLRAPLIITARHPHEGGAGKLSTRQRRDLLAGFLDHADYLDVELRSARPLQRLLAIAERKKVGRIISFHDFKSTPSAKVLAVKERAARAHRADIFKVATRTDTPMELGRLLDFTTNKRTDLPLAVMGIGKLGAVSRVALARAGSSLVYGSLSMGGDIEGQLSLEELWALGIGAVAKN